MESSQETPASTWTLAEDYLGAGLFDRAEQFLAQVDGQLLAAKAAIEALLLPGAGEGVSLQSADVMSTNVVGVGIGIGDGVSAGVAQREAVRRYPKSSHQRDGIGI
jgi:hypothetical protein